MTNRTNQMTDRGFPSPFEISVPPGCEGWEELYTAHVRFCEARRPFEEGRFWFHEALHAPEPLYPFDAFAFESAVVALNQSNSRLFAVPPSLGSEVRILNGYVYITPNSVTDEAALARREELFEVRAGYYFEHWNELYDLWVDKVEAATAELQALEVPDLPTYEDESVVTEGTRRRLELPAARRLRSPARGTRPRLPVPLRAAQPRLRGIPRLLRALPRRVP